MRLLILLFTSFTFSTLHLFAEDGVHVGRIVKLQGIVEILKSPSKALSGSGPHVLYNGLYYTTTRAKLGTKIDNGEVVRTGKDGKIKVVFKNGDQYNVGIGTAYKVDWKPSKDNKQDPSAITLLHGTIRGIINKQGPRSGLKVQTKHAVMGIRGTDFHIGQHGSSGASSVSVLRGKVAVTEKMNPNNVLQVEKGFTAEVATAPVVSDSKKEDKKEPTTSAVKLAKTSKVELIDIQKDSKIEEKPVQEAKISKELKQELSMLESKAVENTLTDIKEYEPELYEKITQNNLKDIDSINTVVVKRVFEKAPEKKVKANLQDIDFKNDAYEKYFKIQD